MILKLWCWLWGHKVIVEYFTGEYGEVFDHSVSTYIKVPIKTDVRSDFCRRCGRKL